MMFTRRNSSPIPHSRATRASSAEEMKARKYIIIFKELSSLEFGGAIAAAVYYAVAVVAVGRYLHLCWWVVTGLLNTIIDISYCHISNEGPVGEGGRLSSRSRADCCCCLMKWRWGRH